MYARGAYRQRFLLPPLPLGDLPSSEEVDFSQDGGGVFTTDDETGEAVGTSDTMNRVLHILAFEVPALRDFSTPQARAEWSQRARRALRVLTDSKPPVISDLQIVVESPSPGQDNPTVTYTNNATGESESPPIP